MEFVKDIGRISVFDLTDYILKRYGPMSHLKLQKLLFYCEAYHLAYFDRAPLTGAEFQAWVHGPVCREVFDMLKDVSLIYSDIQFVPSFGSKDPALVIKEQLTSKQLEVLDEVLETLSGWKDSELESATHNESPWLEARNGIDPGARCTNIISTQTMYEYYRKELGLAS